MRFAREAKELDRVISACWTPGNDIDGVDLRCMSANSPPVEGNWNCG